MKFQKIGFQKKNISNKNNTIFNTKAKKKIKKQFNENKEKTLKKSVALFKKNEEEKKIFK